MIQSLVKAANILEYMKLSNKEYTIAEISDNVNIPPSTTHRILNTLMDCDYVIKDDKTHLYRLGPGLISLGIAATSNISLQNDAYPIIKELSNKTQEDAFLIIKSGNKGLVIAKVEGPHPLKVVEHFGLEIPLHMGAIRKVLLAFQPDNYIDYYLNEKLTPYFNGEMPDKEKVRAELMKIREEKISCSTSEYIKNGAGIGAPVFDYKKDIVASIGIIAPVTRITKENQEELKKIVEEYANKLSRKLGYY